MKRSIVFLAILAALFISALSYWLSLSEAKRWVIMNGEVAEAHANIMLNGGGKSEVPIELLDLQISTYQGWVLFSQHDDRHSLILAYAPKAKPAPLKVSEGYRQWIPVSNRWYVLSEDLSQ